MTESFPFKNLVQQKLLLNGVKRLKELAWNASQENANTVTQAW